jgi:hypothetical protein
MSNKFIVESKSTDGKFGLPNKWMPETTPLEKVQAERIIEKRELNVGIFEGIPNFLYRLIDVEEEQPKKKKKVNKKS